jgi:hypothetical protein
MVGSVEPIRPGTIKDCRDFLEKYSDVDGFRVYGNDRFIYQYIAEKYPEDEIKFDINKIKLVTIDIEVAANLDSLMSSIVQKNFFWLQFRTIILNRLLHLVLVLQRSLRRM